MFLGEAKREDIDMKSYKKTLIFSQHRFCTQPSFESESFWDLEMAYCLSR